jgi:hypothetical protein
MPGNYQHNPDPALAKLLHTVTQEGWGNDSAGDVQEDGFAASLLLVDPAEQQELTDTFDQPVPAGNFIVHQDRQGVVTVNQYRPRSTPAGRSPRWRPAPVRARRTPPSCRPGRWAPGTRWGSAGGSSARPATWTRRWGCCGRRWTPTRSGPTSGSSQTTATPTGWTPTSHERPACGNEPAWRSARPRRRDGLDAAR